MNTTRKRPISSCIPCYTRKQKCNREVPCNHCTRRGCVSSCTYYPQTPVSSSPSSSSNNTLATSRPPQNSSKEGRPRRQSSPAAPLFGRFQEGTANPTFGSLDNGLVLPDNTGPATVLAESFGYFQHSNRNILAVMQQLDLAPTYSPFDTGPALNTESIAEIGQTLQQAPDRSVMDFLISYFVAEISWMDQLVHIPWLRSRYQAYHAESVIQSFADAEFYILILRIGSYTLQFLPSPIHPLDTIRGTLLAEVRQACDTVADRLEATISFASNMVDGRGSLVMVQQLAFAGLKCQTEGRLDEFWELLGRAVRLVQRMGLHNAPLRRRGGAGESQANEAIMARRVLCNLYIWDSQLSRQLDRVTIIQENLVGRSWSDLHVDDCSSTGTNIEDRSEPTPLFEKPIGPNLFAERQWQARLATFWRKCDTQKLSAEYDIVSAEERYDKFCNEFLSTLPRTLALTNPDESWDNSHPKLPLQRKMLHVAIFDSLCWNFRPILFWRPDNLPSYKAILHLSQQKALATAALHTLECVAQLHLLLRTKHIRLAVIIVPTFEGAVTLLSLLMAPQFPGECTAHTQAQQTQTEYAASQGDVVRGIDILQAGMRSLTRTRCIQAAQSAVTRLRMLAEVSSAADSCASVLVQLLERLEAGSPRDGCPQSSQNDIDMASGTSSTMTTMTASQIWNVNFDPTLNARPQMQLQPSLTDANAWMPGWMEPLSDGSQHPGGVADTSAAVGPWFMDYLTAIEGDK